MHVDFHCKLMNHLSFNTSANINKEANKAYLFHPFNFSPSDFLEDLGDGLSFLGRPGPLRTLSGFPLKCECLCCAVGASSCEKGNPIKMTKNIEHDNNNIMQCEKQACFNY
jgi:hypothetical protein